MKLKTRIVISFFVIILVPVLLTGVTFCSMMHMELQTIGKEYGIENPTYENLINNTLMLNKMTESDFDEVRQKAEEDSKKLEDTEYLNTLNKRLLTEHSFLVVRKDDEIYYKGSSKINDNSVLATLPAYGDTSAASDSTIYLRSKEQAIVRQADFLFSDGSKGSVFIITYADQMIPQVKNLMVATMVVIVLILAATSLLMSLWIYRGVVTPINQLKRATQNIREGNLDFSVEPSGAQEVKELCQDFEEMRLRLKESAEEKISFDSDNKELISNISHDLKTPITAVKGYVEGIMDGVADTPEKMDRYIRTIYNKANEMDRLINELTFYSKIDTNRIPYTFSKIHVSDYFEDCVEEMNLELEAQGIDLTYFNYLEEDTVIIADAEQLKRVINNVVSNSIKYMDKPRGVINIRLRDVGDFIQVEIEDNGKGIAQKDLTKIFDRFYRTDASRNSLKGGSGIGLSIVKKILEDHGGKVWATSKEGVGTVMYFVLRKYQEVPADE
ncbi:MAG: HAMP domain-containing sensor histidine kinase [Lachnospiraceae bacterium]|nr:HAMP domain-containing sensor histidine kinase [Lachnospiraceae bacterium]